MIGLCPEHGGDEGNECPVCQAPFDPVLEEERRVKLSKLMSGALRHFPEELDLSPDEEGWVPLEQLAEATRKRYVWATEGAVRAVAGADPKGRFQIDDGDIRAVYGHSIDVELDRGQAKRVPEVLYHATARSNLASILSQGLLPMERNEVHLQAEAEEALEVGRRHDEEPVLLAVDAQRLSTMGYAVRQRSETVYTTDQVPPDCLEVSEP